MMAPRLDNACHGESEEGGGGSEGIEDGGNPEDDSTGRESAFGSVVVVQTMVGDDLDEVFRPERSVTVGAEVVGGSIELRPVAERDELPGLLVELAAGQEAERQERVRRAEQPEVDLERLHRPGILAAAAAREKVDAEPRHDALFRQHVADPVGHFAHRQPVVVPGREPAAEIGLPLRAAENLIVRGDWEHFAARAGAQLHRR